MTTARIAILGSTSHIAKGLIHNFTRNGAFRLDLYARSGKSVRTFLESLGPTAIERCAIHEGYSEFFENPQEVIINCVGVGTLKKLGGNYAAYFTLTEEYDNLALSYLKKKNPQGLYISFSSGAVYGRGFAAPAEEGSMNCIAVNQISPEDFYGIARLHAEAKHRAHENSRIIDLRIFSYFSRFIDLTEGYFITDVLQAVLNNKVLVTDQSNMVRDYLHPQDLFAAVMKCIGAGKINRALDICSSSPVNKKEILEYFSSEYGLKFEIRPCSQSASATGAKQYYYSAYNRAVKIGYTPQFTSMQTLRNEAMYLLPA